MFTGIVRELGTVEAVSDEEGVVRLTVRAPEAAGRSGVGDSVSINGVCLTAVAVADGALDFDVVPETLRRSSLGRLEPGVEVNVEPALLAGEPLGGHIVQGWRSRLRPRSSATASRRARSRSRASASRLRHWARRRSAWR